METTIYTTGYLRWTFPELYAWVRERQALLCDIRYAPHSRRPEWSGLRLRQRLGEQYLHLRAFGNLNYRTPEAGVVLVAPEAGLALVQDLLGTRPALLLMCACQEWQTCHRRVVARLVASQLQLEPQELAGGRGSARTALNRPL